MRNSIFNLSSLIFHLQSSIFNLLSVICYLLFVICYLLSVNCYLLSAICYAQPTQEWVRRYNDNGLNAYGERVKVDQEGNVYVMCAVQSADFRVLKYNAAGSLALTANYGTPGNLTDDPDAFDLDANGNIYVTGRTWVGFSNYNTTVKFNSSGVLQWAKANYGAYGGDIKVDGSGNIILVGSITEGGISSALIIKYNSDGDTLWTRRFRRFSDDIYIRYVVLDNSNNIYGGGSDASNYLVLKYDSAGNFGWYATWTSSPDYQDYVHAMAIDANRNTYVIGSSNIPFSSFNNTLVKVSSNGVIQWARTFTGVSGVNGNCGIPRGIACNSSGTAIYYTTLSDNLPANTFWDIVTLKYNSAGDSEWVKVYYSGVTGDAPDAPSSIKLDKFGNVYVAGNAYYQTSGTDYVLIRYSNTGVQQWVATYSGLVSNSIDGASDLFVDTILNLYVTGSSGTTSLQEAATIKNNQPVGIIPTNNELPKKFKLRQNYPNPFNSSTVISYELPYKSNIGLFIYNPLGQIIKTLVNSKKNSGYYHEFLTTDNIPSGVYFYSLVANNYLVDTKKLVIIK